MIADLKTRLRDRLTQLDLNQIKESSVVLMPDFFLDHFVMMKDFTIEFERIKKIHNQGGGNVPGINQRIQQGGNAANTALALSRLGVSTALICQTDQLGLHLLKFFLGKHHVDLQGVKTNGKLAITTAMEFGAEHKNVLVNDVGSVSSFSFEDLYDTDLNMIRNSDIVCVLNWTLNTKGTTFTKKVLQFAKKYDVITFFDSGDPSPRLAELNDLLQNVLTNKNLDILGVNENELRYFCSPKPITTREEIIDAAKSFKSTLHARLDIHTASFACTIHNEFTLIPTLNVTVYRTTGAGDAWNAGNLFGELFCFEDDERLLFANLVAGGYISSPKGKHPNLQNIIDMLK